MRTSPSPADRFSREASALSASAVSASALSAQQLAGWVDRSVEAADRMLFTVTPREELAEIGQWQRLKDQAFAGQLRAVVAAHNRTGRGQREFAGDEVALAVGASPTTGAMLVAFALSVAALPGLLEACESGLLTERHLRAVITELDKVAGLSLEQRQAVVWVLLARFDGQTPGELIVLLRRLVLTVDRAAAALRRNKATADRQVRCYGDVDGQAVLHARGPAAVIAAIKARLGAELHSQSFDAEDLRSASQREFDLFADLLTTSSAGGGAGAGGGTPPWQVQVIVPFSTAAGGELELAEIPGFGPILPDTAAQLLSQAASLTQVAVDARGAVLAVGNPLPGPGASRAAVAGDITSGRDCPGPAAELPGGGPRWELMDLLGAALQTMTVPPPQRRLAPALTTAGYRPTGAIRSVVAARDRTCVFPGCHRRITDLDHRLPWPLGPTDPHNLQCLCRHHHRAKQAVFTVELTPDGDYQWTDRGGWQHLRRRQGY